MEHPETTQLTEIQVAARFAARAPAWEAHASALKRIETWDDFRALPFSTKDAFRDDFSAFLTGKPGLRVHSTSGSTGQPAFVVYSAEEIEAITVRAAETMRCAGVHAGHRVLNLFGYGTFIAGSLYDWGATRLGSFVIPFGSASMTPPAFAAEAIRQLAPEVVNGVPSYLVRFLGDLRAAGCANLDRIEIVQCAGEVLTPGLRERLQAVLPPEARIFDQYGMTEFGPVAAQSADLNGLHLLGRGLVFEILDDDGHEVAEGEGELVVTSLRNRAMALFRYRTGDRVHVARVERRDGSLERRVRVLHRTDDLTKVRGVLCSKQELVDCVRSVAGVQQFKIAIFQDESGVDRLAVEVSGNGSGRELLAETVKSTVKNLARIGIDEVRVLDEVHISKTVSGKPRWLVDERGADEEHRRAS